jgi:signal transduction histidine kinase/CheY-like chemotaxis protein
MRRMVRRTVRRKLLGIVLLTTLVALFVAVGAFVGYNLHTDRERLLSDMSTQSELLGHMTAAALIFDDPQLAAQNLSLLRLRPNVRAAAIYSAQGKQFAKYTTMGDVDRFPASPESNVERIEGPNLIIFRQIIDKGNVVGTMYLRVDHQFSARVADYLGIAATVMVAAMLIAVLMSIWLQKMVTAPILAIAGIARDVVARRDYSRRAEKISDDEIGLFVESFNDMLGQIEQRTKELERSNQEIAREVNERSQAQQEVMRLNTVLEDRVRERTAQLEATNIELMRAKESADSANLAKSSFLSSMSHELRTPLNAILGFAQLLGSKSFPLTPEKTADFTAHILKAGKHLLELINEVLDLSKVESGTLTLSLEPVELAALMSECQEMMEPSANDRGITLQFPSDSRCNVLADRTRLKQIILNLMSNAIKYNRDGGSVKIDCAPIDAERTRITVQDTGVGLDCAQMEQLFQPFNRLGQESGPQEGTGIGLVLTKRLVELMGGTIGVSSTPGAGSLFWIELKSASEARWANGGNISSSSMRQEKASDGSALHAMLYVEDNPANLKLVQEIISLRSDLRLLSAADGNLGVELARQHQPEVILMDINLPGISGNEALRLLRNDDRTRHIPVIALTANAMPRDIAKSREAGFFQHLTKPIDIDELFAALDSALNFSRNGVLANRQD